MIVVALLSTWYCHLRFAITNVVSSLISKPNLDTNSCSPWKPSVVSIYISNIYELSNLDKVSSPNTKSLLTNVLGK